MLKNQHALERNPVQRLFTVAILLAATMGCRPAVNAHEREPGPLAGAAPRGTNTRKAGDLTIRPYAFVNAKGEKTDAELGVLVVPENRDDPKSNLIELAFVRFPSRTKTPGPPLVYLAGGPGGSGIDAAKGSRFPLFMAFRDLGDVIALDQRGVGMSKPAVGCWDVPLGIPLDSAPSRDLLVQAFIRQSRLCADYWRNVQRVDLASYNTNESADDLEDLRKALGARQISVWSISYGTHLAFAAMRRYPGSISHAILAGVEGPDHTYKLPSSIQRHLEYLSAMVVADTGVGKYVPDLLGLMRSVFDTLDNRPARVEITDPLTNQPVKVTVNGFVMRRIVANNIGSTVTRAFPSLFYRASRGDYEDAAYNWLNQTREPLGWVMSYMMDCSSGVTAARQQQIRREAPMTLLGALSNDPFPEVCAAWDAVDLGDTFRSPLQSNVPTLFISGTLDARTPVSNAEDYRSGFPNSHHLVLEGAVHSDPLFLSSPKIQEVMLDFLRDRPLSTARIAVQPLVFTPIKPGPGSR